jgi:hypothetical protein
VVSAIQPREGKLLMPTFNRKVTFGTDGRYVKVAVFEPTDEEPQSIIVGLRDSGGEYQNIGLDRDEAKRLRDLLDAAITVDEACFLRRPQVIVEGPGEVEPAPNCCTDPDCTTCEISDDERARRRVAREEEAFA